MSLLNYIKQIWDTTSYVNPTRMNYIEDGIYNVSDKVDNLSAEDIPYDNDNFVKDMLDSDNFTITYNTDMFSSGVCTGTKVGKVAIIDFSLKLKANVAMQNKTLISFNVTPKNDAYFSFMYIQDVTNANSAVQSMYGQVNKNAKIVRTINSGGYAHQTTTTNTTIVGQAVFALE